MKILLFIIKAIISCFLPMKTGILYTDGARYFRLKKGGKEGIEEEALFNFLLHSCILKNPLKKNTL